MTTPDAIANLTAGSERATDFLRATREGLRDLSAWPQDLPWGTLLAAGAMAALVAALLVVRHVLARRADRASFAEAARNAGLADQERDLLRIIARLAGLKHPQNVLNMADAFACGAGALLTGLGATSLGADQREAVLGMVRSLRQKLGHDPVAPRPNRRRFIRTRVNQPAMIARWDFSEEASAPPAPRFVHATLTEIAGPGLVMRIPIRLSVGQRALVVIRFQDGRVAKGLASVRRADPDNSQDLQEIALEMLGLGGDEVALLARQSLPRFSDATGPARLAPRGAAADAMAEVETPPTQHTPALVEA